MNRFGLRSRIRDSEIPSGIATRAGELNTVESTGAKVSTYQYVNMASSVYPGIRERTYDVLHPGPPFVTGSNFTGITIVSPHYDVRDVGKYDTSVTLPLNRHRRYDGGFVDPYIPGNIETLLESDYFTLQEETINATLMPNLDSLGAAAYSKLRPKLEHAGIAVALAEAKDVPRMLQSSSRSFSDIWKGMKGDLSSNVMQPKKVANEFVNQEFGWFPFVRDMSSFNETFQHARLYMDRISDRNNKWTRRYRREENVEAETLLYTRTDISGCQPAGAGNFIGMDVPSSRLYTIKLQELTEVWYEGTFKYYRPEFDKGLASYYTKWGNAQRLMTLYGAAVNPVVLWKITPWSWAADWYSNAGNCIQAIQDAGTNAFVTKYMYLMHHYRRRLECRSRFTTSDGQSHDIIWYRSADIKRRRKAGSPFAFSLGGSGLSATQIAILAALGIGRLP